MGDSASPVWPSSRACCAVSCLRVAERGTNDPCERVWYKGPRRLRCCTHTDAADVGKWYIFGAAAFETLLAIFNRFQSQLAESFASVNAVAVFRRRRRGGSIFAAAALEILCARMKGFRSQLAQSFTDVSELTVFRQWGEVGRIFTPAPLEIFPASIKGIGSQLAGSFARGRAAAHFSHAVKAAIYIFTPSL